MAQLLGLARLVRRLGKLSDSQVAVARLEVKRGALNVQTKARRRAAVDTGRLRNSITHEVAEDGLSAVVGTNVEYAPYVEFGTRRMRARPFLFPALEEEVPAFRSRLRSALARAAQEAAR